MATIDPHPLMSVAIAAYETASAPSASSDSEPET